jgi:signal transduction histidine kinase/ActR/RegA family two-component response regulator
MQILHLEDSASDALLVQRRIAKSGISVQIVHTASRSEYLEALERQAFDVVLVDNTLPGFDSIEAIKSAKALLPTAHVIVCSGAARDADVAACVAAGAADYVLKDHLWQLTIRLQQLQTGAPPAQTAPPTGPVSNTAAAMRLVQAVQELSMARNLDTIIKIVRSVARELTGADGATFVLRDGDRCHYVDEDAISPLWKGQRFPLSACISGWAMLNGKSAVIPDIYADPRIPADAYRPTFVKSLVMVPIRTSAPIGSIGNYWARQHRCTPEELYLLEALANTTAVAMENVSIIEELESRVRARTAELQTVNDELEAFGGAVSHDLRAPLRAMLGEVETLAEQALDSKALSSLAQLKAQGEHMQDVVSDLLRLSYISRSEITREPVDLSAMAIEALKRLKVANPHRQVATVIEPGIVVEVDRGLISIVMENLLSNAWKYSSKRADARIEFSVDRSSGSPRYVVNDNGAGFDPRYAERLFKPFQRLHSAAEFPGTGVGLATVQRIVAKHGGTIQGESSPGQGARFSFTLGAK